MLDNDCGKKQYFIVFYTLGKANIKLEIALSNKSNGEKKKVSCI